MAESALAPNAPSVYEPSLFGTYSKKIGMWLFLLSDSLTFGALLYAYSYGRISTPNWPTPFHSAEHRQRYDHDSISPHQFVDHGAGGARLGEETPKLQRLFLLATMAVRAGF